MPDRADFPDLPDLNPGLNPVKNWDPIIKWWGKVYDWALDAPQAPPTAPTAASSGSGSLWLIVAAVVLLGGKRNRRQRRRRRR